MGRIIFLIFILLLGLLGIKLGYKEVRKRSDRENLLEALISIFLGDFDITNVGVIIVSMLTVIFAILALILGWGK
ncbi:hypothetical protein SAMN00017405_0081 [Desulfonispora thiosulfatigenes DSM 11270]|uniref:Uncharacterized protein n=1 Tax=Desulfonispora thiosulfatigenes DSM 11270 TaxID=656914 RepID=A0A1W1VK14_DESTI|nr:hypothetical protein [Desulfonispora thiosulfatigenes]SMB93715.1 hypothetical protein SAMN00017405_0081 [Desulfonispora thiosulfatigenes DSM 11270]